MWKTQEWNNLKLFVPTLYVWCGGVWYQHSLNLPCYLMLLDVTWCYLMLLFTWCPGGTNVDGTCLVNWCYLMQLDITWCYLKLIDVTWCYLILLDVTCYLMSRCLVPTWLEPALLLKSSFHFSKHPQTQEFSGISKLIWLIRLAWHAFKVCSECELGFSRQDGNLPR